MDLSGVIIAVVLLIGSTWFSVVMNRKKNVNKKVDNVNNVTMTGGVSNMEFCYKCGEKLTTNAQFCRMCGTKIQVTAEKSQSRQS